MSKKKHSSADIDDAGSGWTAKNVPNAHDLEAMIKKVGPRKETAGGNIFFLKILGTRGPEGVLDTLARFRTMLDEGDGLDRNEMQRHESNAIPRLPRNILSRRDFFMISGAWAAVGATAVVGGVSKATDHLHQSLSSQGDGTKPHDDAKPPGDDKADHKEDGHGDESKAANHASTLNKFYEGHILPYENMLVGAALVNEGFDKWKEIKIRQIEDTVLRIPDKELEALEQKEDKSELRKELATMINTYSVSGKNKDWVARDFLMGVLENPKGGEQAVIRFIKRASTALDTQSELDLEIDLALSAWPEERKIFDNIRLPAKPGKLSKSDFLETWGWIIPGCTCLAEGGLKSHAIRLDPESPFMKGVEKYSSNLVGQTLLGHALTNEASINWEEIKLEQIGDAVIDINNRKINWDLMKQKPLKLDEIIENMDDPKEKFAGIYFLRTLLKSKGIVDKAGVERVKSFLERAKVIMGESSAQDLPEHFTKEEKEIFAHYSCRPNFDMANSLETVGWGVPGAICRASGYATAADIIISTVTGKKKNVGGDVQHYIHDRLGPLESGLIGAALIREALKKFEELNLGQISDATAQLVDMTRHTGVSYR